MSKLINDRMLDLYANMSLKDKEFMLHLMRNDIFVPVEIDYMDGGKTVCHFMDLDPEMPFAFNGAAIQINLDGAVKINRQDVTEAIENKLKINKNESN